MITQGTAPIKNLQVFSHFPKCYKKILLQDFNGKLGRKIYFQANKLGLTVDMTTVITRIMTFRVENLATSKNTIVNRTIVPH